MLSSLLWGKSQFTFATPLPEIIRYCFEAILLKYIYFFENSLKHSGKTLS